jgi:hypothetical protein
LVIDNAVHWRVKEREVLGAFCSEEVNSEHHGYGSMFTQVPVDSTDMAFGEDMISPRERVQRVLRQTQRSIPGSLALRNSKRGGDSWRKTQIRRDVTKT